MAGAVEVPSAQAANQGSSAAIWTAGTTLGADAALERGTTPSNPNRRGRTVPEARREASPTAGAAETNGTANSRGDSGAEPTISSGGTAI